MTTITVFKCELCSKEFKQNSSRNRHVREQHLQPGLYRCKHCGQRFSKKYNLQNHEQNLHIRNVKAIDKHFKCSHCDCFFSKPSSLMKHTKRYHRNENNKEPEDPNDPSYIAASVLKELKQLQNDLHPKMNMDKSLESTEELTVIEMASINEIIIKDNLYPSEQSTQLKVQTIKRIDGITYFICEYCSKEFRKTYNYLRHRRTHTKVRPYICVLCKKAFPTSAQLRIHSSIHTFHEAFGVFNKLYKCPKCEKNFSSINSLDKHLNADLFCNNVTFQCSKCLKTYKTLQALSRHNHNVKDNELTLLKATLPKPINIAETGISEMSISDRHSSYVCNICGLNLKSRLLLKQHERRHQNLQKYQCLKCKQSYASQFSLKMHTKLHWNEKKHNNFLCDYCNKTFKTFQNCRRHMMIHLKQLTKTHDELQDYNETLLAYPTVIEMQDKNQILITETCVIKKSRNTKTALENGENHLSKYKCSKCDKSFRFNAWLKAHFKYKHTSDYPYECCICMRKFRTKQTLQTHHLVHSNERKKHPCQVCGKKYASSKSLKLHLRIHTQEKPFTCEKCFRKFRTSGHLIQHCKSNHLVKAVYFH